GARRLQRRQIELPPLGWPVAPAGAAGRCRFPRLGIAAAWLPPSILGARHARRRPSGDEMREGKMNSLQRPVDAVCRLLVAGVLVFVGAACLAAPAPRGGPDAD